MIVITLTDCPPALRGDLTRWLQEISTGVYAGQVSARVRDELWDRIRKTAKTGRATMVFSANNEQRMDFHVHNSSWMPINYDGIKLMMRPKLVDMKTSINLKTGFSDAAKFRKGRQMTSRKHKTPFLPTKYVVLDLETTGLSVVNDSILEIGAILVDANTIINKYNALVRNAVKITKSIANLTGISDELLERDGKDLKIALMELIDFAGDTPIVSHNANFDFGFLRSACENCKLPLFSNRCVDTLTLSQRLIDDVADYKLNTLLKYFEIEVKDSHRSMQDCIYTMLLYEKLIEIFNGAK